MVVGQKDLFFQAANNFQDFFERFKSLIRTFDYSWVYLSRHVESLSKSLSLCSSKAIPASSFGNIARLLNIREDISFECEIELYTES